MNLTVKSPFRVSDPSKPSLRRLAGLLGLSVATVSLALRDSPRIRAETTRRVKALAGRMGYHSDPVVSEGLSRVRRGTFYRETLAWCLDEAPEDLFWLATLFQATRDYGRRLGYQIEFFELGKPDAVSLRRKAAIWKARGIRGVFLGPFSRAWTDLQFPWRDFVWVSLDQAVTEPTLHQAGRDYDRDITRSLALLAARGCSRPGFVVERPQIKIFRRPMLQAALFHYHGRSDRPPEPYVEIESLHPRAFAAWLKRNRPDGLLVSRAMPAEFVRIARRLPMVIQSEYTPRRNLEMSFGANYESWGQAAVNFMHRLLTTRQFGIPACEQCILVSSLLRRHTAKGGVIKSG